MQQALNWLEDNQDKSLEELQAAQAAADADAAEAGEGTASIPEGVGAKSLVCNDCGKKFRTHAEASFHASKTCVLCPGTLTPLVAPKLTRVPASTPTSPSPQTRLPR